MLTSPFKPALSAASRRLALLSSSVALLCQCSATSEPPSSEDEDRSRQLFEDTTGRKLAATSFGPDPEEIGTDWYDYSPRTHVLTPKPFVYALRHQGETRALFRIESYYDDRGESGAFTLEALTASSPHQVKRVTLPSIKTQIVCLDEDIEQTDCASERALLVLRIAPRVIPGAGFTVKEPGLYLHQPYDPDRLKPPYEIAYLAESSLQGLSLETSQGEIAPSSTIPSHSRIGWLHPSPDDLSPKQDIYLHATSTLHVATWQIEAIEREGEALRVALRVGCQVMSDSEQAPLDPEAFETVWLTLDGSRDYDGYQVTLCDAEQETSAKLVSTARHDRPPGALWADAPSDLILSHHRGHVLIRPAAGTLVLNWTYSSLGGEGRSMEEIELSSVWEMFL